MSLQGIEEANPGFKAYCKELFLGNECDTDEYRETQPGKGLGMIADWAERRGVFEYEGYSEPQVVMLRHVRTWIDAIVTAHEGDHENEPWLYAYAGAEELGPVLDVYFEELWRVNEHPYGVPEDELLQNFKEDQQR